MGRPARLHAPLHHHRPTLGIVRPDDDNPNTATAAEIKSQVHAEVPSVNGAIQVELEQASQRLESAEPGEILRWAVDRFAPKLTMGTAFGPEGMVIIHLLSEIAPDTPIFNLETGYQFKETLELRDRVVERYGIQVALKRPELTIEQYEALHGGPLYNTQPNQFCPKLDI